MVRAGLVPNRESVVVVDVMSVVYECPSCAERGPERRCPDCNMFCRRLGPGGRCPSCDEMVLVADLGADA